MSNESDHSQGVKTDVIFLMWRLAAAPSGHIRPHKETRGGMPIFKGGGKRGMERNQKDRV